MRKIVRIISVMALGIAMFVPTTAFASSNSDAILVSTEQVTLTSSEGTTRSAENKKFILKTYDDNGATVYSFDVENEEYRQAAMEYINKLTGDPGPSPQTRGPLLPGQSEYHNDTQYEGAAMSYAWKRNTASTWGNNFEGGSVLKLDRKRKVQLYCIESGYFYKRYCCFHYMTTGCFR